MIAPALLTALSLANFSVGSRAASPGQTRVVTVDFALQANLIVVDVTINGVQKLFVLDTGASATVVGRETARELRLAEAQKAVGRGAGGDVAISLVRVASLAVGDLAVRDLTAMAMGLDDLNERVGGDIAGILGFDFLSRFKVTIDYRARELTLERYAAEAGPAGESPVIEGKRFVSAAAGLSLERPDSSWIFVTETPLPQILLIMKKEDGSGTVTVQVQEVHGVALDRLVPAVEASLAAQVEEFAELAAAETEVGGHDAYVIDYRGKKGGVAQRFRHFIVKVAERLYSFNCRADASEFPTVEAEFASILGSVAFLPANRDP